MATVRPLRSYLRRRPCSGPLVILALLSAIKLRRQSTDIDNWLQRNVCWIFFYISDVFCQGHRMHKCEYLKFFFHRHFRCFLWRHGSAAVSNCGSIDHYDMERERLCEACLCKWGNSGWVVHDFNVASSEIVSLSRRHIRMDTAEIGPSMSVLFFPSTFRKLGFVNILHWYGSSIIRCPRGHQCFRVYSWFVCEVKDDHWFLGLQSKLSDST